MCVGVGIFYAKCCCRAKKGETGGGALKNLHEAVETVVEAILRQCTLMKTSV